MADINLSKTQLQKIVQSGGFLGPLLKTRLPLIGNVIKPLTKHVLIPLGLVAAVSATGAAIYKKMFGSGFKTLIICNKVMNEWYHENS